MHILHGSNEFLRKASGSKFENKFHKIALYFWNLSSRNINAQKMLNYTLSSEILFYSSSFCKIVLHFHTSSSSIYKVL